MTEAINRTRLNLLRLFAKHPGLSKDKVLAIPGVTSEDLAYLIQQDLIREREVGQYRVTHLGDLVLKRQL